MERLVLTLLGGLRARLESGPSVTVPGRKGQALLAYLACAPGEVCARDMLATLLWGDTTQRHARHNLRQTLFLLNTALRVSGAAIVRAHADAVTLEAAGLSVDVVEFERLARRGTPESLEQAVALYHGDLLSGIAVGDQAFEEWLRAQRERLHETALEAFARLLALQSAAGATAAAIETALRLLALDPLQEPVHRALMRLYARAGRSGAVLRQYRSCLQALGELELEPETETTRLLRELVPQRLRQPAAVSHDTLTLL
jgi:DNA-binding SARP family transcriptional activator